MFISQDCCEISICLICVGRCIMKSYMQETFGWGVVFTGLAIQELP